MERLTNHFNYCEFIKCKNYDKKLAENNKCKMSKKFNTSINRCYNKKIWEKLKKYEELEEEGLLKKFFCNVGDTLYCKL